MKKVRILALVHDHLVPPDDTTGIDVLEAEWKMEYDVIETLREIGHEVRVLGIHDNLGGIRTAAHDFGPQGIRVNVIAPGPTESPMLDRTRLAIPGGVEARIAATPLRKAGTGAEVGAVASFLLSDRASHLSGVILPVDGGFVA